MLLKASADAHLVRAGVVDPVREVAGVHPGRDASDAPQRADWPASQIATATASARVRAPTTRNGLRSSSRASSTELRGSATKVPTRRPPASIDSVRTRSLPVSSLEVVRPRAHRAGRPRPPPREVPLRPPRRSSSARSTISRWLVTSAPPSTRMAKMREEVVTLAGSAGRLLEGGGAAPRPGRAGRTRRAAGAARRPLARADRSP